MSDVEIKRREVRQRLIDENEFPDIPENWGVERLRFLFTESKVRNGRSPVGEMLSVSEYRGVVPREYEHEEQKRTDEELENYRVVRPGQLAVNSMWLNHLGLGVSEHTGHVSPAYNVYEISDRLDRRFVHHLMRSNYYLKIYLRYLYGIRPNSFQIKANDWASIPIIVPDLATQRQIADFLDRETARIDLLIEKKQRLVALLGEKRTSIIRHLVTGADTSRYPDRKLSNSPWFHDLPAHWKDAPVKRFAKIESGHTPSRSVPEYWEDASIKWISLADSKTLRKVDFIDETTYQISALGLAGSSARILPQGTVIFTRDATVGLAAITSSEMAVSQHLVGWVCGPDLFNEYLLYVFYAMEDELNRLTWGATIKTIGMPDLRALRTCLPPLNEQQEIVRRIRAASKQVTETTARLETSIDRLKEYRAALITAAVTGQIDVEAYAKSGTADRRLDAIQEEMWA